MTHNTDAELLPCPFCGTDAKAVNSYEDDDWRVECWNDECSVHGKRCQNRSDAALEWNRRAPAAPVPHDVVRDACARMCDARAESLQAGNMFTAANEAFKCAMAIRTHPAYQHHLRAAVLAAAPQPPESAQVQLPEPVGVAFTFEAEEGGPVSSQITSNPSLMPMGWTRIFTEQQVRQLLAAHGIQEQST